MKTENEILIKTSENDNVGIVINPAGIKAGSVTQNGIELKEFVPMGHKVALTDLKEGDAVIRYGQTIGYASKTISLGF